MLKRCPSLILACVVGWCWLAAPASAVEQVFVNSLNLELILIESGQFIMGGEENNSHPFEYPEHRVVISKPFYLGKYEVTQAQWLELMDFNPSEVLGDNLPVESITWEEASEFVRRLNERENTDKYRLPTEAEWEYAARAGIWGFFHFGDDRSLVGDYAWYIENSEGSIHPVGQKLPNAWGLYDTAGNVWEWVQDWYGDTYYAYSPMVDPQGPFSGSMRVARGGAWYEGYSNMYPRHRHMHSPSIRFAGIGFRLARDL